MEEEIGIRYYTGCLIWMDETWKMKKMILFNQIVYIFPQWKFWGIINENETIDLETISFIWNTLYFRIGKCFLTRRKRLLLQLKKKNRYLHIFDVLMLLFLGLSRFWPFLSISSEIRRVRVETLKNALLECAQNK